MDFYHQTKDADVRTEFVRKFGIERMSSLGKVIDTHENHDDHWYTESAYELIDMSPIFNSIDYAPHLKMKHQTMGMFVMEPVSPHCRTIEDALSDRNEENMREFETISIK